MNRKQRINNLLLNHLKEFSIEILDNSHLHINHNNFDGTGETHIKIILEKRKEVKFDRLNLHRKINELLKNEFELGMHSLEIKIN
tara:strand:+ start:539 stop:793 length:255 start_codon:yes stop_codon:yes gene_type:complete